MNQAIKKDEIQYITRLETYFIMNMYLLTLHIWE